MQKVDERIRDLIRRHKLGIIATINPKAKPEAAVIEYGETEKLELIFDTFIASRKYNNIMGNPNVAFVIGWDENITIQYEGVASELSGNELERCKGVYFAKNPRAKKWEGREGMSYFKITPKWIRYSDLNKSPWEILETTF